MQEQALESEGQNSASGEQRGKLQKPGPDATDEERIRYEVYNLAPLLKLSPQQCEAQIEHMVKIAREKKGE
jgi:hypothetical protein